MAMLLIKKHCHIIRKNLFVVSFYPAKPVLIKKVAAKAIIAYNSGNTARIRVLPKTSFPLPISTIPLATIDACCFAEIRQTKPRKRPIAKTATPVNIDIVGVSNP